MKKRNQQGFTLIEMIGVLAIIAILVGAVAPRIFEAIQESKANNTATLHKTVTTAVTKFYADVGYIGTTNAFISSSLANDDDDNDDNDDNSFSQLLQFDKSNHDGVDQTWAKFRGPYLDGFVKTAPPVGTAMGIHLVNANNPGGGANANNDVNYDLDFDGETDIPGTSSIATLFVNGVGEEMFEKIDAIIDGGLGDAPNAAGKVKWSQNNGGNLRIYIRHD